MWDVRTKIWVVRVAVLLLDSTCLCIMEPDRDFTLVAVRLGVSQIILDCSDRFY